MRKAIGIFLTSLVIWYTISVLASLFCLAVLALFYVYVKFHRKPLAEAYHRIYFQLVRENVLWPTPLQVRARMIQNGYSVSREGPSLNELLP